MTVPTVFARPERLRQFRVTAGALADGLAFRCAELDAAVDRYRVATERAYEADCGPAADTVAALGLAVRHLGEWVGRVGDAFDDLTTMGGVAFGSSDLLLAALPPELRLTGEAGSTSGASGPGGIDLASAGLTFARAAAVGIGPRQLDALAVIVGPERQLGRVLASAAESPRVAGIARYVAVLDAAQHGVAEGAHRWQSEPDRPWAERGGRAAFDGALTAAGSYGGTVAGERIATQACTPFVGPVAAAAVCGPVGATHGAGVGRRAAEAVSDHLLGDEPEAWERDPQAVADEIADVDPVVFDAVEPMIVDAAAAASADADRHADFVMEHPWRWSVEYPDAPVHGAPPAAPEVPVAGPR